MKRVIIFVVCMVIFSSALVMAAGENKNQIKLQAFVEKDIQIVNEAGDTVIERIEASKVIPGDEVIYSIKYEHVGNEPAENVVIVNPIPEHLQYTAGTAIGENTVVAYSIDGGKTFNTPENLKTTDLEGNMVVATPAIYTHIRWTVNTVVNPSESGLVSFRAKLQ